MPLTSTLASNPTVPQANKPAFPALYRDTTTGTIALATSKGGGVIIHRGPKETCGVYKVGHVFNENGEEWQFPEGTPNANHDFRRIDGPVTLTLQDLS